MAFRTSLLFLLSLTATLPEPAGTGTAINVWLAAHGFDSTRANSRTPALVWRHFEPNRLWSPAAGAKRFKP